MENSGAGEITTNTQTLGVEYVKTYLERNDLEGAKAFLKNYVEQEPMDMQAAFIMAQILESQEEYKEAADLYDKVFPNQIPDEFQARVMQVFELADKYDRVYDFIKAKYEKNPDDTDILERYANTCCILHKNDEAIELYNNILTKNPNDFLALRQLSDIYENYNPMMYRLTRARLFQLEENLEGAEKEYKKAFTLAEKDEDVLQIRYKLAKLYRTMGKNEQALDEYIFIAASNDNNFSILIELAEIYLEMNNTSSAINALKKALTQYPDGKEALQLLADTYVENEEYTLAENYYERLVELDDKDIENLISLAKVYLHLDKLDKTKEMLMKASSIDDNSTEVLTAMAGYYTYTQDFDNAKNYCNRIIQKLPKSPLGYRKLAQLYEATGENHLSHFNYGIYHEMKNEIDEAVNEYNYALQIKKDDFEIIKRLANLHENLGESEAATDYYHMLIDANIDTVEATKKIAALYIKLNDYEFAQKYIENAMKTTDDIELMFLNGKVLYKLKDFEGALEALQEYKDKTKSLENIDETNKLIKAIEEKKEEGFNPLAKLFKFLGI